MRSKTILALLAIVINSMVLGVDIYCWVRQGKPPDWITALALFWVVVGLSHCYVEMDR